MAAEKVISSWKCLHFAFMHPYYFFIDVYDRIAFSITPYFLPLFALTGNDPTTTKESEGEKNNFHKSLFEMTVLHISRSAFLLMFTHENVSFKLRRII